MAQLVELNKNAEKFAELDVKVIAIFREEASGIEGLEKIKERTKVDFILALDQGAKQTASYSPGKMEFDSYVVDGAGKICGIINGDLRNRAKSKQLLEIVTEANNKSTPSASDDRESSDDRAAVERAVLDYVEGVYEVKPDLIERGVHKDLAKFGYWRPANDDAFKPGSKMTFDQLKDLAGKYNANGLIPEDAPKEIVIFEVMDKMASAKLTAHWGVDYFHLVKNDDKWQILQVVWQSPPK